MDDQKSAVKNFLDGGSHEKNYRLGKIGLTDFRKRERGRLREHEQSERERTRKGERY